MKRTLLIGSLIGLAAFAGPTHPKPLPPGPPSDEIILMSIDEATGDLTVNDDNGKNLGHITAAGVVASAKKVKSSQVLLALLAHLKSGIVQDDQRADRCEAILNHIMSEGSTPVPEPTPAVAPGTHI